MPTTLSNGVTVINLTPHTMYFACEEGVVQVHPEGVLNALPVNEVVREGEGYKVMRLTFCPMQEGIEAIRKLREAHPNALLVGSSIAAQTYPGEVVSSVPVVKGTSRQKRRLVRPDLFTTYQSDNSKETK